MPASHTITPPAITQHELSAYPSQARQLAVHHLALLNQLPPAFAASLLKELIAYDWKFPAERTQMDRQLALLSALSPLQLSQRMASFAAVRLSPELAADTPAQNPSAFVERLTAWLWSSSQMEPFRSAAEDYSTYLAQAAPMARPSQRRLGIVIIGQDAAPSAHPLFVKLRPHGLYLSQVKPENGLSVLLAAAAKRSSAASTSSDHTYKHWYIDGGSAQPVSGLTQLSYAALQPPLQRLLQRIQHEIDFASNGPEGLRSTIAQMQPEELGLPGKGPDAVLGHFTLSLLTEGAGTQIFATTFVQWSARECLRRAQPETLVLRYAPRRQMQPMNVMLSDATGTIADPQGSLTDADMGAYYTWLNMNRLSGADEMSFLVWFEGQRLALAIGPTIPQGSTSTDPLTLQQVLNLLA